MSAHRSTARAPAPVPSAGNASRFTCFSSAFFSVERTALRTDLASAHLPSGLTAAWMIHGALSRPPLVTTAVPSGTVPILWHSSCTCWPATRRIAPETPPPITRSLLAEFTIASASTVVMSPRIMRSWVFIGGSLYQGSGAAEGFGKGVQDVRRHERGLADLAGGDVSGLSVELGAEAGGVERRQLLPDQRADDA